MAPVIWVNNQQVICQPWEYVFLHVGTVHAKYSDTSANEDNSFRNHIR